MTAAPANGNGTARWQLWVSLTGVMLTAIVVLGSGFTMFANLAGQGHEIAEIKANYSALEARLSVVDLRSARNQADIGIIKNSLCEIETQFKASDQTRNVIHANDLRMQALLFRKSFGTDYPIDDAFYPSIARELPC